MAYTVTKIEENSWNVDGSAIVICDCGHAHKTLEAAIRCRDKLIAYNKKTNTWSAKWNNAKIFENGSRVPNHVISEAEFNMR